MSLGMQGNRGWIDTHCHLDAAEFNNKLPQIIQSAVSQDVRAILLPAVCAEGFTGVKKLATEFSDRVPGLVYTLGIHPLYVHQAKEDDLQFLAAQIQEALSDSRFVGIGEIGLDYFVEGLDQNRQEMFFHKQLDLAQEFNLPVVLHVRRSQDAVLKALRQRRVCGGIAHAFNGSFQQAEQFIKLGFKLGFGGAATYTRALQIRRLLTELPIESIVTETDSPDIPPAWLWDLQVKGDIKKNPRNEPAFLPKIALELAQMRGLTELDFSSAVWRNAMEAFPRWRGLLANGVAQ